MLGRLRTSLKPHLPIHLHSDSDSQPSARIAGLIALCLLVTWGFVSSTALHAAETADAHPEMDAVSFLEGRFMGEAWQLMPTGERVELDSFEHVERRLDGAALLVEGIHRRKDTGERIHHALAMLTWNRGEGRYDWRTALAGRDGGNFEGRLEDGAFVWEIDLPGRLIRYTIRVEDGRWLETGVMLMEGSEPLEIFGMDLQRIDG